MIADAEHGLYWLRHALYKRRLLAAAVAASVLALATAYIELTPPVYAARATLAIEPAALGPGSPPLNLANELQAPLEVLSSGPLTAKVGGRMGWNPNLVARRVSANVVPPNLIRIIGKAPAPEEALALVEAVMAAWRERDIEVRSTKARRTVEDLSGRYARVQASLRELEERRQEFLERHPEAQTSASLADNLAELGLRRQELLKRFTPEHPEVLRLAARGREMGAKLNLRPATEKELQRINRELKIQEDIYGLIARQLEEARVALATVVSPVTVVSGPSLPVFPVWPKRSENYLLAALLACGGGLLVVLYMESMDMSLSTIEEVEKGLQLPVLSVIPRWTVPGGGPLARFWPREGVGPADLQSALLLREPDQSDRFNPYHRIRTSVQAVLKPGAMILTFTSAGTNEGKTLTAINFCLAAARAGLKVLLVGMDMHRGSIQRIFKLPDAAGLAEVLDGRVPWRQALRSHHDLLQGSLTLEDSIGFSGIEKFHLLPGARARDHAYGVLSERSLSALMGELRLEFDVVVVDCPPAMLFGEVLVMARHTDGVVLVYRCGRMSQTSAHMTCEHLRAAQARLLGIVLNDATIGPPEYYYYASGQAPEA